MTAVTAVLVSGSTDVHDAPLDADVIIDNVEYARILRGIAPQDDGPVAVSRFNSTI
jgi:hypothetical protein